MRIALIASNHFAIRQPFAGGLEAHVWHLSRALARAGHHVSLFAAPGSDLSLDCAALQVRDLELSAAAVTDPSMPAAEFMADHHAYLTLMSGDERERMARFVFEKDRHAFLLTRALVRTTLSRYAPVPCRQPASATGYRR